MPEQQRVVVTNVDIGFFSLVWLLVKLALAAIPAAIVIAVLISLWVVYMSSLFALAS